MAGTLASLLPLQKVHEDARCMGFLKEMVQSYGRNTPKDNVLLGFIGFRNGLVNPDAPGVVLAAQRSYDAWPLAFAFGSFSEYDMVIMSEPTDMRFMAAILGFKLLRPWGIYLTFVASERLESLEAFATRYTAGDARGTQDTYRLIFLGKSQSFKVHGQMLVIAAFMAYGPDAYKTQYFSVKA